MNRDEELKKKINEHYKSAIQFGSTHCSCDICRENQAELRGRVESRAETLNEVKEWLEKQN